MIPRKSWPTPSHTLKWAGGYVSQAKFLEGFALRHVKAAETPPRERDQQSARVGAFECYDASRIAWINAIRSLIT